MSSMVDAPPEYRPALSPSRAADFKQCPLLYRLRAIDRIPAPPTRAQLRGTLVHAALEALFGLPAADRTPRGAHALIGPAWETLLAETEFAGAVVPPDEAELFLTEATTLVSRYFELEDPSRFEPESCEQRVEFELPNGVPLRGYVDRIDVAPTGELRVVDYKTGRSPSESFEARALFQMKFYALVLFRTRGIVPSQLRLVYLANGELLTYRTDADELVRFERTLTAIWTAIVEAGRTGDFRPKRGKLCSWCDHRALCPEFGGVTPDYPGWPGADTVVE